MGTINVDGSAARLLANKTLAAAGYCLHYCWLAISQGVVHYITGGADTAYNTWLAVPESHRHTDRNVPKDFPAFLGPKLLSKAGDVIISSGTRNAAGELLFVATDWPKSKQVGLCTLAQREKQTGRKSVGWASSMGGHELVSTSTAGDSGTPLTTERKVNPVTTYVHIYRKGVGEFIMKVSATRVSLSPELTGLSDTDRQWRLDLASKLAVANGLPPEIPLLDDTKEKDTGAADGWFLRNQFVWDAAGMPSDYPLTPDNPFDAIAYAVSKHATAAASTAPAAFSFTGTATSTK